MIVTVENVDINVLYLPIKDAYGIYWSEKQEKQEIWLDSGMSIAKELGVLEHEIGHAKCYNKKCKCVQPSMDKRDKVLCEYHANKYALKQLLLYKNIAALDMKMYLIKDMASWEYVGESYNFHIKAAQKIMKTRLWHKCKKYVKANWPKSLF